MTNHKGLRTARIVSLSGIGGLVLLISAMPLRSSTASSQDGPATEFVGQLPAVSVEVPLGADSGAVMHLSFLLSREFVEPVNRKLCRVASVFTFTTVNDQVQYNFGHISPTLTSVGKERIETTAGYDQDGKSADFTVFCEPRDGLTWRTVTGADDLAITVVQVEDKR